VPEVRQLLPLPADDVDPFEAHASARRPAPAGRPWVALNMVASVDGATAVEGRSGALGGPADRRVFSALRSAADVILVAAGTVRAEGYGPPRTPERQQAARRARGQTPFPRIVVVSRSLDLDATSALFVEAVERPLVITAAGTAVPEALAAVAEVQEVGDADGVDLAATLALLGRLGHRLVLCEGGPTLNGQLIAAGLVDEVDLTLSPLLVGGGSRRVAVGPAEAPTGLGLAHLWHDADDDLLFARYARG
jgi:riboflavin-specific deaminase-like protein